MLLTGECEAGDISAECGSQVEAKSAPSGADVEDTLARPILFPTLQEKFSGKMSLLLCL